MINVSEQELSMIIGILKEHVPNAEVRAFGSRCKGTNKKHSDLDIAILAPEKLDFDTLTDIRAAFDACELPFRVDVLDYNAISEEFRNIIDKNFEVIFPE